MGTGYPKEGLGFSKWGRDSLSSAGSPNTSIFIIIITTIIPCQIHNQMLLRMKKFPFELNQNERKWVFLKTNFMVLRTKLTYCSVPSCKFKHDCMLSSIAQPKWKARTLSYAEVSQIPISGQIHGSWPRCPIHNTNWTWLELSSTYSLPALGTLGK